MKVTRYIDRANKKLMKQLHKKIEQEQKAIIKLASKDHKKQTTFNGILPQLKPAK